MSHHPQSPSKTGPDSILPGAYAAMSLLLVINLFNYIDRQVLAAVVTQIREAMLTSTDSFGPVARFFMKTFGWLIGGSPENIMLGLLPMAFLLPYIIFAPWLSTLRVRRWWIISGGIVLWSLASFGSGLARNYDELLLTRALVGIGEAAYGPFAAALLSDYFPEKHRGKALSFFYLAIPVGSALGYAHGGIFAGTELGWRWAFFTVMPPGILLGLLCLLMKEPKRASVVPEVQAVNSESRWQMYKVFLTNRSYVYNTIAMTAMTFAIGGIAFWMPDYIHKFRGEGTVASVNIILGGILVVSGLIATILGGYLADTMRSRLRGSYFKISGWAMLVGFPCCVGIIYAPFPLAWVFLFLACFCLFLNTGPSNTALANVVAPQHRPSAFALNILIIHLFGDVISPVAIGTIADATGKNMNIAFLVVSVMVLAGGYFWLVGAKHLDEDTQRITAKHG